MTSVLGRDRKKDAATSLRVFDFVLGATMVVLAVVTVVAVPLGYLAFTGRGTFTVEAELVPPYSVGLDDGRAVDVAGGGTGAMINFPIGEERRYLDGDPSVRARVKVDREDRDARAVLAAFIAVWLGLVWTGLTNLRRIVWSARQREPFDPRNVARLRWLGGAVLASPIVTTVAVWAVDATLDVDPPVQVLTPGPSWWVYVVVGLGLFALAEVFRAGTALRELEQATI